MSVRHRRTLGPLVAFVLALAAAPVSIGQAHAHGGDATVQLIGQSVAGYDVSVMTAPKRPRVGAFHVKIQLIEPRQLTYGESATVTATARFLGEGDLAVASRRSRYREPWHELDLNLSRSGRWRVQLSIDGPDGQGDLSFVIRIPSEAD